MSNELEPRLRALELDHARTSAEVLSSLRQGGRTIGDLDGRVRALEAGRQPRLAWIAPVIALLGWAWTVSAKPGTVEVQQIVLERTEVARGVADRYVDDQEEIRATLAQLRLDLTIIRQQLAGCGSVPR